MSQPHDTRSHHYDVFLCHSSVDKPAVEKLARKIRRCGLNPFLDKWNLIPGEPWQEALEDALTSSKTCAVFLGGQGLGPWQNEEMRIALSQRSKGDKNRVIPVLLPGAQEKSIPAFLSRMTWVDFRRGLENEKVFHYFICGIQGTVPKVSDLVAVTPYRCMAQQPEGFVARRELEEILVQLCAAPPQSSTATTIALHGAGGFGKTALAQAVCYEATVRRYFPHGILWLTMGETVAEVGRISRVRDLLRWWHGEEPPTFETIRAAGAYLRDSLNGNQLLVVLDDVWSSADIEPLQGLSPDSAILVTTRDRRTLPRESRQIKIETMEPLTALRLLTYNLEVVDPEPMRALATELGEWPLLLKLVNSQLVDMVENGVDVYEALRRAWLGLGEVGLTAFDVEDDQARELAVSRTLDASLRRLSIEDQRRFIELVVFPEGIDIPLSVLKRLWALGPFLTEKFCGRLAALSLLQFFDRVEGTIRLHDVVREYLVTSKADSIRNLQEKFLNIFYPASQLWIDIPQQETYLWNYLGYHLVAACQEITLRDLLLDFDYIHRKIAATDITALLDEYHVFPDDDVAWTLESTLRLSSNSLMRYCHEDLSEQQLAGQILGRLMGRKEQKLQRLLSEAKKRSILHPLTSFLARPGEPMIRILEDHSSEVYAVAIIPPKYIVSASGDKTIRVWNLTSGEVIQVLKGHTNWVLSIAVSTENRIISGSADKSLCVWDLASGEITQRLHGHTGWILGLALLTDDRVVSASSDKTLRIWDLESGETIKILKGHSSWVSAVKVLKGNYIISASYDKTLRIWDLDSGETIQTLQGHETGITGLALVADGRVVSASSDKTLRLWDLDSGSTIRVFQAHSSFVNSVAAVGENSIVSASSDSTLRVWNLDSGETVKELNGHAGRVNSVVVVDDSHLVSASADKTVRLWNLDGEVTKTYRGHTGRINALEVVGESLVISASYDGTLRVWDLESGEPIQTLQGHTLFVNGVAALGKDRVISASDDESLRVWDLETGETIQTLRGHTKGVNAVTVVDQSHVISASKDNTLRVWDLNTGETIHVLQGHTFWVTAVVVDGNRAISASDDSTLRIWDLLSGDMIWNAGGHSLGILDVEINDEFMISASRDRTLCTWNLGSNELKRLNGHTDYVNAVTAIDSHRIISASEDHTLRVWDLESNKEIGIFTLDAPASAVTFAAERRLVIAGDHNGGVHFLNLAQRNSNKHIMPVRKDVFCFLSVTTGPSRGACRLLHENPEGIVFGRRVSSKKHFFRLDDPAASREHCVIKLTPIENSRSEQRRFECQIKDLGSTNGTFVDGAKVNTLKLCDRSRVQAGESEILVVFSDPRSMET